MRYAKLINGFPTYAPNPIKHNDLWYGNPPTEVYAAEGYKPVVYTDHPSETPSGYAWTETWAEEDGNIIQQWVLVEVPISDEDALVRYSNELTGAEDETLTEATETLIKKVKEEM